MILRSLLALASISRSTHKEGKHTVYINRLTNIVSGDRHRAPWKHQCDMRSNVTATHCNKLQHTATNCNKLQQCVAVCCFVVTLRASGWHDIECHCNTTHCNTLQHTATHCNTLQHRCFPWKHLCDMTSHVATTKHTDAVCCSVLQCVAVCCNVKPVASISVTWYPMSLQHKTHCNTLLQCVAVFYRFGDRRRGVWANVSRLLRIIGLFCRILSLLQGSFTQESTNIKGPTIYMEALASIHCWQITNFIESLVCNLPTMDRS